MGTALDTSIRTNEAIRADVLSELKWDAKIRSPDIAVAVANGAVTLSGYVPTYWEKQTAEAAAKRVVGVRDVASDIEVKLSETRAAPEIARDSIRELDAPARVPAERIKVTVQAGWVTLEGDIDSQYQKDLVESAVRKLKGVIGVTNLIEVKPSVSPVEIKTKIEDAFKRNAQLDARRIAVRLYGSVRSWAEREAAEHRLVPARNGSGRKQYHHRAMRTAGASRSFCAFGRALFFAYVP